MTVFYPVSFFFLYSNKKLFTSTGDRKDLAHRLYLTNSLIYTQIYCCSIVQSCPALCNPRKCSTRLPYLSLYPGVCSNSCPLCWWCHPTISSSVTPFISWPQYFPASGSFPMSRLFAPGGQSIGASASASVLMMNIQGWFSLGLNLYKQHRNDKHINALSYSI